MASDSFRELWTPIKLFNAAYICQFVIFKMFITWDKDIGILLFCITEFKVCQSYVIPLNRKEISLMLITNSTAIIRAQLILISQRSLHYENCQICQYVLIYTDGGDVHVSSGYQCYTQNRFYQYIFFFLIPFSFLFIFSFSYKLRMHS